MAVIRPLTLAASLLLLAGCATTQSITPHPNEAASFAPWSDAPTEYRVGAGDRIRLSYLLTPELDGDVLVGPDGYIGLATAGRVLAQGATIAELKSRIEQASRAVLTKPIVTLSVTESHSVRIVVGGAVHTPGVYAMPSGASPLEMIVQAGGFEEQSRMDEVVVIRPRVGQRAMLRTLDLRRFVERGEPGDNIALAPGDIVFVPRSRIAEADLWVQENIERLVPFSRNFSYSVGSGAIFR